MHTEIYCARAVTHLSAGPAYGSCHDTCNHATSTSLIAFLAGFVILVISMIQSKLQPHVGHLAVSLGQHKSEVNNSVEPDTKIVLRMSLQYMTYGRLLGGGVLPRNFA